MFIIEITPLAVPAHAQANETSLVKVLMEPTYAYVDIEGLGRDELILVGNGEKYGYINNEGEEVIPLVFSSARQFSEGFAAVAKSGRWGVIDTKDNVTVPFEYDELYPFKEGLARARKGNKWGYVNSKGDVVIQFEYDELCGYGFNEDGLTRANKSGKWGVIDTKGNVMVPFEYDELYFLSKDINKDAKDAGKDAGEGAGEDTGTDAGNGRMVLVEKDNKKGIVDTEGNIIVPCEYYNLDYYELFKRRFCTSPKRWEVGFYK